jgi:hypothetical protein
MAAFHHCRCDPEAPYAFALFWQVYEGARLHPDFLKLRVEIRQGFL